MLAFLSSEFEVGMALTVQRWYDASAFASGDGETHELGGRQISGGGRCSSRGSGGDVKRLVVYNRKPFCPMPIWEN